MIDTREMTSREKTHLIFTIIVAVLVIFSTVVTVYHLIMPHDGFYTAIYLLELFSLILIIYYEVTGFEREPPFRISFVLFSLSLIPIIIGGIISPFPKTIGFIIVKVLVILSLILCFYLMIKFIKYVRYPEIGRVVIVFIFILTLFRSLIGCFMGAAFTDYIIPLVISFTLTYIYFSRCKRGMYY